MKRYWKYIRPYIQYYILGPCFMMMEVVGDVLLPYMLAKIINQGIAEKNVAYIIKIGAIMGFIAVIMAVGGVLGAWFASKAAMNFGADLRMDLFEKIQQFSFQNIDNFSTGSLITRLTNDITQIQNMIMMTLRMCLRSPGILIGAMVMAFVISPKLAAIFIIVLPVLAVLIVVIMRRAFPQFRTLQEKLDALNSCIQEGLVGIRLIKSFVRGDYEEMRFEKRNQQLKEANLTAMKTMLLYTPLMTLALNITTVVVVWSGGNMIVAGNMQVGDLTAFTNYIVQIMSSLTMLSIAFLNWARAIASFRRVGEVLDEKIDLTDENAKHKDRAVCEGSVEFQNVSFRYYKNSPEWVIENISFKLEAGKTLGIIGPTGSGKTYLVKTLARLLDVPLAITDATSLTEAGYIGDDIESVVSKLLAAADNDVERAEQGIIFIDEIDKIAKKKTSSQRDVSGESVQQGMLKLLEGSEVEVPVGANSKNAMVPLTTVNTKNILFICGGAFDGIEKKIAQRMNTHVVGYNSVQNMQHIDKSNLMKYILPQDLKSFGLIPEIIGRLPVLTYLNPLDRTALRNILTEPKNSIVKQQVKLFEMDGIKLSFDEDTLEYIVDKAVEYNLGARGLRSIMESIMMDAMFEIPSKKVKTFKVTLEYAKKQLEKANLSGLKAS